MESWFELSRAADGQFRFALKGDRAQTLLMSELYRAMDGAQGGIAAIRKNCGSDASYEKKVSSDGRFFFNLKSANHQVVGTSPRYASEQERDAGIAAVKAGAATAAVREGTA